MTQQEIASACGGIVQAAAPDEASIVEAYTSDLLSDVMAHAPGDSVLITIQNHINTVAVCTLVGVITIVICNNREIPEDMRNRRGGKNWHQSDSTVAVPRFLRYRAALGKAQG